MDNQIYEEFKEKFDYSKNRLLRVIFEFSIFVNDTVNFYIYDSENELKEFKNSLISFFNLLDDGEKLAILQDLEFRLEEKKKLHQIGFSKEGEIDENLQNVDEEELAIILDSELPREAEVFQQGFDKHHYQEIQNHYFNMQFQKVLSEAIEFIKERKKVYEPSINENIRGYKSNITSEHLDKIYNQLIDGGYIYKKTIRDHFKAIFRDDPLPNGFKKVKWILMNRKREPHKTAFREFLTLTFGKAHLQKISNAFFTDSSGNSIELAKPKRGEHSNFYIDLEKIVN